MIIKNSIILFICLCMSVLTTSAQAIDCNCPEDISKFKDATYFKSFYPKFEVSCLTDLFYIENEDNKAISDIIRHISQTSGTTQQVALSLKRDNEALFSILKKADMASKTRMQQLVKKAGSEVYNSMTVKTWSAHLACEMAKIAEAYYIQFPEEAPPAHQKFYTSKSKPALADSNNLDFSMTPIVMILLGAVLFLSILISALITGAIVKKRLSKHQPKAEAVLQDPLFLEWVKSLVEPINTSLAEQKKIKQSIQSQEEQIKEIKALGSKLDNVIKQSGAVDVDKLQQVLSDLSKRVKDLEDLPVRRENLRIVLQPEDFMNFLQKNPDIREAVKEGLDIVQLRDTISKLLPHPLTMKDLGDLEKETIARYWRIYKTNKEYLPALLEEWRTKK